MTTIVAMGLGNLAIALALAGLAWLVGHALRRPALTHGLWVLVFLKLITPPLSLIPLGGLPFASTPGAEAESPVAPVHLSEPTIATSNSDPADSVSTRRSSVERIVPGSPVAAAVDTPFEERAPRPMATPQPPRPVEERLPLPSLVEDEEPSEAALQPTASWPTREWAGWIIMVLGTAWLAGTLAALLKAGRRVRRFHRLLSAMTPAPERLQTRTRKLAEAMHVACPDVVEASGVVSPLLWVGGRRAFLVVPVELFSRLDPVQQTALLVHELAHWRRGDHWVRRLETIAQALYWWCPLLGWMRAQLHQAEEECCDAWVVATVPQSARAYALALVETVDFLNGAPAALPPLASGLGPLSSLQRRLKMIFRSGTPRVLTITGAVALIALGALLLPWSPTHATVVAAQDRDEDPPRKKEPPPPPPPPRKKDEGRGPREGPPREGPPKEGRKEFPKDGPKDFGDLERLHRELRERQAELNEMERHMRVKMRELQMIMERLHQLDRKDGERPPPNDKRPDFKPDSKERPPFRPDGPPERKVDGGPRPDLEKRLGDLERKIETLINELRGGPDRKGPPGPRRDGDRPAPPRRDGDRPPGPGPRDGDRPPERRREEPRKERPGERRDEGREGRDGASTFAPLSVLPARVDS